MVDLLNKSGGYHIGLPDGSHVFVFSVTILGVTYEVFELTLFPRKKKFSLRRIDMRSRAYRLYPLQVENLAEMWRSIGEICKKYGCIKSL